MKTLTGVKSQTRPVEIDDTSSDTTVFERYNIKEITEIDPVFKTESVVYTYDENQYTFAEWHKITIDKMNKEIALTQSAMLELLDILGISENDISKYEALSTIFNKNKE